MSFIRYSLGKDRIITLLFLTRREKLAQAYNFALEKMGMDIASFPIWNEYIRFLKSADAVGSYAENQKIAWIRKVYQRAVVNPMLNIEQAWFVATLFL